MFKTNFFWIQNFDSWTCSLWGPENESVKPCSREQSRANLELFSKLALTLSLHAAGMIIESTIFRTNLFGLKGLIAEHVPLESQKKICWILQQNGAEKIQSYIFS